MTVAITDTYNYTYICGRDTSLYQIVLIRTSIKSKQVASP